MLFIVWMSRIRDMLSFPQITQTRKKTVMQDKFILGAVAIATLVTYLAGKDKK